MPRIISGQRIGRVFGTPTGSANVETEIDFQLGPRQGVQIESVLGHGIFRDNTPTPSDTAVVASRGVQSLHLDTGTLETVPMEVGDDEVTIDSEIFYIQTYQHLALVGSTNTFGAGMGMMVLPNGLVVFPEPILAARNITHRVESIGADVFLEAGLIFYYKYVEFSVQELGFLLARR